jgi:hypothetical protein
MRGKTYEEHIRERAQEVALRKLAAAEATALYGVEVEDREMAMLTPNEMQQSNQEEQSKPTTTQDDGQ